MSTNKYSSISESKNTWAIEKFMKFENCTWTDIEIPNISLKICYDLLVILANNTILHSLSLNKKLKVYFKENTFIFAYEESGTLQKIKIKLDDSVVTGEVEQIVNAISAYTPMHDFNKSNNEACSMISVNNFQKLLKEECEKQIESNNCDVNFPPGFPLNDFVKMCLMDPSFPQLVERVEKCMQQFLD